MSFVLAAATLLVAVLAMPSSGRDRPFSTSTMHFMKLLPAPQQFDQAGGQTDVGGQFSKKQIEQFTCEGGTPAGGALDISCNDTTYGQDWAPDNEIAIAVDPEDPDHLLAGSNDYYYRFNNSTGARQALVPTGFFTSFDGGETWLDGQVPFGSGNGNGDPAPAFDAEHDVALMAQLANVGGQGGAFVAAGNVSVGRSLDGGVTWQPPVTVFHGTGAGIGPAKNAVFWDKEYIAVDNNPSSDFYGRIYVTASRFLNGLHGSYAESPIWLSYSDDGGETWSNPKEISGSDASCSYQETGAPDECDEDQDSNPVVASDGTLYVYFLNAQNEEAWEVPFDFDSQVMVVKSVDGGETFSDPVSDPDLQMEDGLSDMPWSVIGRLTVWGHQIRWASFGNLSVDPQDPEDLVVTWSDRGAANPNAAPGCFFSAPGTAPNYDPCTAGPGSTVNIYMSRSTDGGASWGLRTAVAPSANPQWFPWAGHLSDGTLVVAFDQDTAPSPADTFRHVLSVGGGAATPVGPIENVDVSVTHWAGQYTTAWPAICGPAGYADPPVTDAEGKDCNVFHGDYTGLAVGPDDAIHIVWTGLNRTATSPQIDFYTGEPHDGYAQDAMYRQVVVP
jgi:hypothetical protein